MPRRAQPVKLTVAETPNPEYPSLLACFLDNMPLLVKLATYTPNDTQHTPDAAAKREKTQANDK